MIDAHAAGSAPRSACGALDPDVSAQLPLLRHQLLRHARMAIHDAALAEDLVQDTLITVVQQHHTRRGDSTLRTWATAILKHKVADWYRSPTHLRLTQLDDDNDATVSDVDAIYDESGRYREPVPTWQQPEEQTERKQMMLVLEGCLGCLPHTLRRVFMMREWLGFDTSEICARLGVTADSCRMSMHRARTALRTCMQRDWIGAKVKASSE